MVRKFFVLPREILEQRFREKYQINESTGCWEWVAYKSPQGRGMMRGGSRMHLAPRIAAYLFLEMPLDSPLCVCHRCDNPGCVNPEHLFLGTQDDNMQDMKLKGRGPRGEKGGGNRFTRDQVLAMFQIAATEDVQVQDIAARFGTTRDVVSGIFYSRNWYWLKDQYCDLYERAVLRLKSNRYKEKWRKVVCVTTGARFPSVRAAAEAYQVDRQSVGACCRGKRQTVKGFSFAYDD